MAICWTWAKIHGVPRSTPPTDGPPSAPAEDVLDRLPYGVVVVHAGAITRANIAAARLLWSLETGGPPAHCHELFACRAAGGPCEDGCLAEGIRVERWSEGSVAARVRAAAQRKVPVVAVFGAREAAAGEVSLRERVVPVSQAIAELSVLCKLPR